MTLWEPKVDIMSWKRHIRDKPAGMVMEQTAGVRGPVLSDIEVRFGPDGFHFCAPYEAL